MVLQPRPMRPWGSAPVRYIARSSASRPRACRSTSAMSPIFSFFLDVARTRSTSAVSAESGSPAGGVIRPRARAAPARPGRSLPRDGGAARRRARRGSRDADARSRSRCRGRGGRARPRRAGSRWRAAAARRRARVQAHGAALEALGDAVGDRVLDQRLQEERRHQARERRFLDSRGESQAGPEPYLLDGEEVRGQGELFGERHAIARPQGQAAPQELAEEDAHLPRLLRAAADEGVDRVEAVEEEMGMDLGAQGAQLRLAREDLEAEGLRLRAPRVLQGHEQVVQRGRKEKEQEAHGKEHGRGPALGGDEARQETEVLEQGGPDPRRGQPQRRGHRRGHDLRSRQLREPGQAQGRGAADPVGAEAHERVEGGQGHGQGERRDPREPAAQDEGAERARPAAPRPGRRWRGAASRQDRMHRPSS